MIEFTLERCYDGWQHTWTPDNLKVSVDSGNKSVTFHCSLFDLARCYAYIVNHHEAQFAIGTGGIIELTNAESRIVANICSVKTETTRDDLETNVQEFLTDVFRAQDEKGQTDLRKSELQLLDDTFENDGVPADIQALYDSTI